MYSALNSKDNGGINSHATSCIQDTCGGGLRHRNEQAGRSAALLPWSLHGVAGDLVGYLTSRARGECAERCVGIVNQPARLEVRVVNGAARTHEVYQLVHLTVVALEP